jgi:DisA bacterial checkpoint controller nucleotide-binding
MTPQLLTIPAEPSYVFPPALVRLVRERLTRRSGCLSEVTDDELARLLTTVFFAGLETYEGEHNPIGVVFLGRSSADFVIADGAAGALPLYQWKILRFASPRPFASIELVKLGVSGTDHRIYSAVGVLPDGRLAITGLAREGFNSGPDPFIKIVASRPGCLSIRSGRELVIEYERGSIRAFDEDEELSAGPVRQGLEAIARSAGVDDDVVPHYLDAVAFLVHEIVAHGRGGILIVSADDLTSVAEGASYGMIPDSSLAALLRLAWRAGRSTRGSESESPAFGQLLRNAFITEAERVVEEIGRLTAIDGAVLLNRDLALVAFGVILPVGGQIAITEGKSEDAGRAQLVDFGTRGTRHRASATYAWEHLGSVVFVASEDGQVSCMLRERFDTPVRLWHLTAGKLTSRYLGG